MTVFIKAKELIDYTLTITDNTKRFPKKLRFTFVNRMQNIALDVYFKLLKTNEVPANQRVKHQIDILSDIGILLYLVELCAQRGCIDSRQLEIWTKKALDVKYLTAAWMKKN